MIYNDNGVYLWLNAHTQATLISSRDARYGFSSTMNNFTFGVHKLCEINLNEMKIGKDDKYIINTKYLI